MKPRHFGLGSQDALVWSFDTRGVNIDNSVVKMVMKTSQH